MKKTLVSTLFISGVLFAQSNSVSNNTINTHGGNINISQTNTQISKEQIEIDRKIDSEMLNLSNSNLVQSDKSFVKVLLNESKKINKEQLPLEEKNRQCKFKVEANANFFKFGNINLAFSYCDKIF